VKGGQMSRHARMLGICQDFAIPRLSQLGQGKFGQSLKITAGQTITIGNKHGLQAVVGALPVQDDRRLTDISPVERKVPISVHEFVHESKSGLKDVTLRTREGTSAEGIPANRLGDLRRASHRGFAAPYSPKLSNRRKSEGYEGYTIFPVHPRCSL
jgi:hypothetical protein